MIYLAVATDLLHAMLMVAWVVGIPLLFWHRFPKLSMAYCSFSLAFIIINQASQYFLGECIFTTIAGWLYAHAGARVNQEWFTVRLAQAIFGLIPTHRSIKLLTEILIGVSAVGGIFIVYSKLRNVISQNTNK